MPSLEKATAFKEGGGIRNKADAFAKATASEEGDGEGEGGGISNNEQRMLNEDC